MSGRDDRRLVRVEAKSMLTPRRTAVTGGAYLVKSSHREQSRVKVECCGFCLSVNARLSRIRFQVQTPVRDVWPISSECDELQPYRLESFVCTEYAEQQYLYGVTRVSPG